MFLLLKYTSTSTAKEGLVPFDEFPLWKAHYHIDERIQPYTKEDFGVPPPLVFEDV